MKTCTRCKQSKPLTEYYSKPKVKSGKMPHCKECHKALVRKTQTQEYWTDPVVLHRQRARRYGLTPEQLTKLIDVSGALCALCGEEKPLHIDHSHETGKIRGMLCMSCNTKLGWLEKVGVNKVYNYLGL